MEKPKVIVVAGPTSSGKSALAIEIAKVFNGEIISADSRQIYQKLNLGSGKVTTEEMAGIPHHLLDIIPPETPFSAQDFKSKAEKMTTDIIKRNKLPIITGGTFFYIDLLLGKTNSAPVPPNLKLRNSLEKLTTSELFKQLQDKDRDFAEKIDQNNRRRLVRALEILDTLTEVPKITSSTTPFSSLILGIKIEKEVLEERIKERLDKRLEAGLVTEVENLLQDGVSADWLISLGLEYKFVTEFILGKISFSAMKEQIVIKSRQYAKRQYTWLKRDKSILWFDFPVDFKAIEIEVFGF